MPKIDAPTVAEHRELRRRQVVDNALNLLVTEGSAAVTPAAVARATGLARTSVYQYFPTAAELVAAAVEESFARASRRLTEAVGAAGCDPRSGLRAYVAAVVRVADEGHHPSILALSSELPPPCRARLRDLHRQVAAPLVDIVRRWGVPAPDRASALVFGVLNEATTLLARGVRADEVAADCGAFIAAALDGLASGSSCPGELAGDQAQT